MKKSVVLLSTLLISLALNNVMAQGFLNKVKQKVKDKVNQKVDNKMDGALNSADHSVSADNKTSSNPTANPSASASTNSKATIASYKNYDFVPGDKIIFESQLADERSGEISSQFTITQGQADVQMENGEKVIHVPKGGAATFTPRLKNAASLPAQYTVEFDYKDESYGVAHINVNFGYRVGTYGPDDVLQGIGFNENFAVWTLGEIQYPEALKDETRKPMEWHHYAIAINNDAGKAYIDQYRVCNVNNLKGKPKGIFFEMTGNEESYMKNVRVAAGGIDAYKKITTDNKIITHGILFDVDKASIQPTSMGTINSIYDVLKNNPNLKLEIDGHTDNTGTSAHNLVLSQSRAEAIKAQLISMGIDASKLTAKGLGDTKPITKNDSAEDRANNRRVEFVKI
jgi:OOP family OmpA-OmpF porin